MSKDYFLPEKWGGLRGSHNDLYGIPGTDEVMDPELRQAMQPWFRNTVPFPALLSEFGRAMLGAWGNYLGDIYNAGDQAPQTQRREIAVRSTLTMGLAGVLDAASRDYAATSENAIATGDRAEELYSGVRYLLANGSQDEPYEVVRSTPLQRTAFDLAAYLHKRFDLANNQPLKASLDFDLVDIARAVDRQYSLGHIAPRIEDQRLAVASELGRGAALLVLDHTYAWDPENPGNYEKGQEAAERLGNIGGVLRHGSGLLGQVEGRVPTYATSILLAHGGATKAALHEIDTARDDMVQLLATQGRLALESGTDRQRGIYNMAVRLLKIKERSVVRDGARRKIDTALNADSFWRD